MLTFFGKHQKKFIGVIIFIVSVSGIGMGWGKAPSGKKQGSKIVLSLAGRKYSERELAIFKSYFTHEAYPFTGNPREWNFLNEGMLTERFLTNKLGETLFLKTYANGYPHFYKEKQYQAYRRFDAPFISAEEVWKSSAPHLYEAFHSFQQIENPLSSEGFMARVRLFLEERKFPHYVLRQMLEYRRQLFKLPQDHALSKDLRLFGYKDIRDWFGERYVSKSIEVLLRFVNEQKQHLAMPSMREARQDFYDKARAAFSKVVKYHDAEVTFEQFVASYFHFLGTEEEEFLRVYREILLCKRAFLQLEGGVAFDYHPLQEFFSMGRDTTSIEIVRLPAEYRFTTAQDLEAFETYIELVGTPTRHCLDVPRAFLPVAQVKSKEPKLVGRRFILTYKMIKLDELEARVPMTEVYQWQQDPENFQLLLQKFPKIETCHSAKDFQNMKPSLLNKIHAFTRKEILRSHPERISSALSLRQPVRNEIFLSSGKDQILEGIYDGQELVRFLFGDQCFHLYSQDEEHYYTFVVESCFKDEEIIPYREVIRRGLAGELLAKHKNTQRIENVISALRTRYPQSKEQDLWQRRLQCLVEEHREGQTTHMSWPLDKVMKRVPRGYQDESMEYANLASMEVGAVSSVACTQEHGPFFYRCLSHETCHAPTHIDKLFLVRGYVNQEILSKYLEHFMEA